MKTDRQTDIYLLTMGSLCRLIVESEILSTNSHIIINIIYREDKNTKRYKSDYKNAFTSEPHTYD